MKTQISRKLRILVADDNVIDRRAIALLLEGAGYATRIVGNGEEALEALDQAHFDLVLMDIDMPVMNGIEATRLYRFSKPGEPHLPIVALTADRTTEVAARCAYAGIDACVTKPINPARMLNVVRAFAPAIPLAPAETERVGAAPVTDIASHPRFRAANPLPTVDRFTLRAHEAVGGKSLLAKQVGEFLRDADIVLESLAASAEERDVPQFRAKVHALRSGATSIGAKALYDLCLQWRQINLAELAEHGARYVDRLAAELERVRGTLHVFVASGDASESRV